MKLKQLLVIIIVGLILLVLLFFAIRAISGLFGLISFGDSEAEGERVSSSEELPGQVEGVSESNLNMDLPVAYGEQGNPGYIEGSLTYPDGDLPSDVEVCAEDVITNYVNCTSEIIEDDRFEGGKGYRLEVPAAKYYVYAVSTEANQRGYYSNQVDCTIDCSDDLEEVIVSSDETVSGIDPIDWREGLQE